MNENILDDLIRRAVGSKASDLHLTPGEVPCLRVNGLLMRQEMPVADHALIAEVLQRYATPRQIEAFQGTADLDFAFSAQGERFRGHAYRERGQAALALRRLESRIRTAAELGLPTEIARLSELRDGLVLVTGPTGSGKSTTLASLINAINLTQDAHIITIEDPVEYIYPVGRALVHQRELCSDVDTFAAAVRASLREDPDIVLVGEMRDMETMSAAVRVAETGHLVFSTLHTGSVIGSLGRIIGSFPSGEQPALLQQLSLTMRAVVAQHLLPLAGGGGRVVAVEVLQVNQAAANLIRQNKTEHLYSVMESGGRDGMRTLEQSLAELVQSGRITLMTAQRVAGYPDILLRRLR